jgi:hypothetical protein
MKFLRDYFYAGGEGPIPLELLQNQKYRDVVSIRLYYDWHTYVRNVLIFMKMKSDFFWQRCTDGRMRSHDAAESEGSTNAEEARQVSVPAAEPWNNQGSQTRKVQTSREFEWRSHNANTSDAVSWLIELIAC